MEEIEAKYRLAGPADHARLRARLEALDAAPRGTVDEENVLFEAANGALHAGDRVLRLRWLDGRAEATLTYKGPATRTAALKRREECEVRVADGATMQAILAGLGLTPRIRYAKRRETWQCDGAEVALDTLEFGVFCEIEGSAEAVERVGAALGLAPAQAEVRGYPALAREFRRSNR